MAHIASHNNRLGAETSPYLLQHSHNPVDWWPWGPQALAEAQAHPQTDPALGRLRRLPLVPRHGARKLRGRSHRGDHERAVRQHQSRSRGAARHRPDLHERPAPPRRAGRLAADHVSHPRRARRSGAALIFPSTRNTAVPAFADVLREVARVFHDEPDKIAQNRTALVSRLAQRVRAQGRGPFRRRPARQRGDLDRARHRSGQWRPARRAEISAMRDAGIRLARRRPQPATRASSPPPNWR